MRGEVLFTAEQLFPSLEKDLHLVRPADELNYAKPEYGVIHQAFYPVFSVHVIGDSLLLHHGRTQ